MSTEQQQPQDAAEEQTPVITLPESITKLAGFVEIREKNAPLIADKVTKAIAALSIFKVIGDADTDKKANDTLVKCNSTIPVIENLRKEYTKKLDEFKAGEMEEENKLKAEMQRVRDLRNTWANLEADRIKKEKDDIDKKLKKDTELARVKAAMKLGVEQGIILRVANGEASIATLFASMTLDNFEAAKKKLNFTPVLKEETFRSWLDVEYDKELMPDDEFVALKERAFIAFKYPECATKYVASVEGVIKTWKDKLEGKKAELEAIASAATPDEAEALKAEADKKEKAAEAERNKAVTTQTAAVQTVVATQQANETMEAQFTAQGATQTDSLKTAKNQRESYFGRFDSTEALIKDPMKFVEMIDRMVMHVVTSPNYTGFIKRHKSGFPVIDDKGRPEYADWVEELFKVVNTLKDADGNAPNIPGITFVKEVSTIARATK